MKVIIDKNMNTATLIDFDKTYKIRILDADIDMEPIDFNHSDYIVDLKFKAYQVIFE